LNSINRIKNDICLARLNLARSVDATNQLIEDRKWMNELNLPRTLRLWCSDTMKSFRERSREEESHCRYCILEANWLYMWVYIYIYKISNDI